MTPMDCIEGADRIIAVWPCDHGNVLVEPGPALLRYQCHTCCATATTYVALPALRAAIEENWSFVLGELDAAVAALGQERES